MEPRWGGETTINAVLRSEWPGSRAPRDGSSPWPSSIVLTTDQLNPFIKVTMVQHSRVVHAAQVLRRTRRRALSALLTRGARVAARVVC